MIREAKPLGNGSILVSDARLGRALVVDVFDGHVGVREGEDGITGNANHVTTDLGEAGVRPSRLDWPAPEVARALGRPLSAQDVRHVMAHEKVMLSINIVSVVFLPAQNKMLLSCGRLRAARGEFVEYTLFPHAERP